MRHTFNWGRLGTVAIALAASGACSSDSDDGTGPTGSIQISVSSTALTIPQGTSGTLTLTLVRGGGFSAPVSVTVEGLPTGITASVAPSSLSGTTTSAIITVNVALAVPPGSYAATVRASASGVADATTSYSVTVTDAPELEISLAPAAINVAQGETGTSTVTLSRTNYSAAVTLSMDTPPVGIGAAFTPAIVTGTTSSLTVTVGAAVAPGTYPHVVRASGPGLPDRTATLTLTVTASPNVVLSVLPTAITVQQGASATTTVTLTRTSFSGPVTLALLAPPAGVSGVFSPAAPTGTTSTLTVSVSGLVPPGQYVLTIRATSAVGERQVSLGLTVTAVVPGQVEYQFCSTSENPVFFAFQDGVGAWQPVTATLSSGVYRYAFALGQGYGGVFFVRGSGQSAYETTVFHGTTSELAAVGLRNCQQTQTTRSVWLQVSGVGNGQMANLSLGNATEVFVGGLSLSPVEFDGVRSGLLDFIGVRASALTGVPNKIQDVRGLDPADGSTLPFIADFNNVTGYDPASAQLVVGNALGDELTNLTSFLTTNGEAGLLGGFMTPSTAVTRTWYGVPGPKLQAGDIHLNYIVASPSVTSTDEVRYFVGYVSTVQDIAPALGGRLPTPTVSSVGVPTYRRLRLQGVLPAEYSDYVSVSFSPSGGGNEILISHSAAYLAATGGTGSYDVVMPDLTGLATFPLASGLPAGELEATVTVAGWSGGGIVAPTPSNGVSILRAEKTVKIVVP